MRPILTIALNDLYIYFQQRTEWIINLVIIPIVIATVISVGTGSTGSSNQTAATLRVDVIDNDNTAASTEFLARLRGNNSALVLCPFDDVSEAGEARCSLGDQPFDEAFSVERLEDQTSLALIIIPEGFSQAIASGEQAMLVYRSNEDATAPSYILQAVQAAVTQTGSVATAREVALDVAAASGINSLNDPDTLAAFGDAVSADAAGRWATPPIQIRVDTQSPTAGETSVGSGFSQMIPGIGSMYVMFAVLPLAALLIGERKRWRLQRLVLMPVSRAQVLAGKLLGRFVLGMIQFGILFGFGFLIGVRYGNDPFALVLLMAVFTLCCTALALMVMSFLKTEEQAQGIALFISLTLAPLGGAWWPLEIVPEAMRIIGHISPIAWAMDGFHELIYYGGGIVQILPMVGVLLAMAVVFFAVGVSRFRFD